jgi:hypothetical protein
MSPIRKMKRSEDITQREGMPFTAFWASAPDISQPLPHLCEIVAENFPSSTALMAFRIYGHSLLNFFTEKRPIPAAARSKA